MGEKTREREEREEGKLIMREKTSGKPGRERLEFRNERTKTDIRGK